MIQRTGIVLYLLLTLYPLAAQDSGRRGITTPNAPAAIGPYSQAVAVGTMIFVAGIVAVVAIIIGGLRYILSQGNEKAIEGAKNTILYAVIGLIVAVLAYAIVNFVLTRL